MPYGLKLSDIQLQPFMASTDGSDRRKRADAWSALHGVQVPAIDVEVAQATLGEQDVGTWSFRVESEEDAMALDDVRASLPGMRVRGQGKAPGGSLRLRWVEGQPRTELVAGLKTRDIGKFFESWGYSRLVESHKGNTDIALEWPGYPTDFDMAEVSGLVDFTWKDGNLTREGSNNPIMRALGVLNFNEALRRIKFDFKDLYQEGLSFDRFEAAIDLERGLARTREPVELQGSIGAYPSVGTIGPARPDDRRGSDRDPSHRQQSALGRGAGRRLAGSSGRVCGESSVRESAGQVLQCGVQGERRDRRPSARVRQGVRCDRGGETGRAEAAGGST